MLIQAAMKAEDYALAEAEARALAEAKVKQRSTHKSVLKQRLKHL